MTGEDFSARQEFTLVGDDVVVPFSVEPLDVRGRIVQLGPMLNEIQNRHNYPEVVSALLGEMIVLTTLLGTSLKFDGNFILQTQSEGPVSLVVVDFSTPDAVRAYARYDELALEKMVSDGKHDAQNLLGKGILAMTIDQGPNMQRYQGIVELDGISLEEAAHRYFRQSEQIPTRIRLSVGRMMTPGSGATGARTQWRAGGILTQFLPESGDRLVHRDLPDGRNIEHEGPPEDEAWIEASALVESVADDELTDPQIGVERLLYRLFNEHGVRVFEGTRIRDKCSCSREKVISLIKSFPEEDPKSGNEDEDVATVCEFCGTQYTISQEEL